MTSIKAIVIVPGGISAAITEVAVPNLRDEWLLVTVKAVAINPTDWKHIDLGYAPPGSRVGCDYAGVVERVGKNVTGFKEGDRVAGFVHGGNRTDHELGAFGEYLIAKASVQINIPDNLSFVQAATFGISIVTCGQGLYKSFNLPLPNNPTTEPFPVLIHGGSTATGMWAIQFAKASGLAVIATASPHNFDRLRSLGADAVFDYRSSSCGTDICTLTKNKLKYAWDCAGGGEALCGQALSSSEPSKYGCINPTNAELLRNTNPLVDGPHYTVGYDCFGEPYEWAGNVVPARVEDMEFAKTFLGLARELLEKGTIRPINITVNKGGSGLQGVMRGLDEFRAKTVSGTKLVYTL